MDHLRLRPGYSWHLVDDSCVVSSQRDVTVLAGVHRTLLPLIDGTRTEDEVLDAVAESDLLEASYALAALRKRGLVTETS